MAFSDLDLCSQALVRLGASPIGSFSDGSAEATVAGRLYGLVRDALISAYPWTFSVREMALATTEAPQSGDYAFRLTLPDDCLRVISAGPGGSGRGLDYRVRGHSVFANTRSITVTFQQRIAESEFPPFFAAALVARLAAEFCLPVTESAARAEVLRKSADLELKQARLIDSQQSTPNRVEDFTLIQARLR